MSTSRRCDQQQDARIITPAFKDKVAGGYKPKQIYVKQQRGALARFIIQQRILDPERIKGYDGHGYHFAPQESTATEWVFLRDKRPPLVPQKLKGGRIR